VSLYVVEKPARILALFVLSVFIFGCDLLPSEEEDSIKIQSIEISPSEISARVGEDIQLSISLEPEEADEGVQFSFSQDGIAETDEAESIVRTIAEGHAELVIRGRESVGVHRTVRINVYPATNWTDITPSSQSLDGISQFELAKGSGNQLTAAWIRSLWNAETEQDEFGATIAVYTASGWELIGQDIDCYDSGNSIGVVGSKVFVLAKENDAPKVLAIDDGAISEIDAAGLNALIDSHSDLEIVDLNLEVDSSEGVYLVATVLLSGESHCDVLVFYHNTTAWRELTSPTEDANILITDPVLGVSPPLNRLYLFVSRDDLTTTAEGYFLDVLTYSFPLDSWSRVGNHVATHPGNLGSPSLINFSGAGQTYVSIAPLNSSTQGFEAAIYTYAGDVLSSEPEWTSLGSAIPIDTYHMTMGGDGPLVTYSLREEETVEFVKWNGSAFVSDASSHYYGIDLGGSNPDRLGLVQIGTAYYLAFTSTMELEIRGYTSE
jgi:hypothetical protein